MKEQPWEPSAEIVEAISQGFRRQMDRAITSAELKTVLDGVGWGWVTRCIFENDLDMEEAMKVARDIEANVETHMARLGDTRGDADRLSIGIGAGFFTGLWIGLLLSQPTEDT